MTGWHATVLAKEEGMLESYFESEVTLKGLRAGPSGAWLAGFAASLHAEGYSWWTARHYLRSANHLGHFLRRERIAFDTVCSGVISSFRDHFRRCRCPRPNGGETENTVRGAKCFVRHLRRIGIVPEQEEHPWPPLVQGFRRWLRQHRGVSDTTLAHYSQAAIELFTKVGSDPGQYDAQRLRLFLLDRARNRGVGSAKAISSGLRMFLRYLAIGGECRAGLDDAIPALAGWRLASLPSCLSPGEIAQIIEGCGQTSLMELRDRAVILLLARLGLRASDVSALRLGEVDWEDGSLLVKGKSRRESRLPLPQEVGDAILAYLKCRPIAQDSHIFRRMVAPLRGLPPRGLSQIVARAMHRAGIVSPSYGSHILRHAAATEMLRSGVSLYDIGSVLRHQSLDMSAYYAKVDVELLKEVVQPWPEVLSC